ncbi:STAS domain-containing protein [Oerskovia flava]|uniref:STAS domain-containing protein n=1 Tax=Oerskovia flava TaxID=2986422 RepID=UPI00223E987B|nr:STAS domain-containing protein [Oerskovia sp. JB1-3-2]
MDGTDTETGNAPATSGISYQPTESGAVVTLWGDIDAALRTRASETMARVIERPGPITVDVAGVDFVDSSGIAFVLQLYMVGREEGFPVELRDPPPAVEELLEMIGIGGQIPVVRSSSPTITSGASVTTPRTVSAG